MLDRFRFWWRVLSRGAGSLNSAAGWLGLIVLLLDVAAGITVPLVFHVSHWLTAVIITAAAVIVVLEGSYRVWAATHAERKAAVEKAEARPADPGRQGMTFWDAPGATRSQVMRSPIPTTHLRKARAGAVG